MRDLREKRIDYSKNFLDRDKFLDLCNFNSKVLVYKQKEDPFIAKWALCFENTDFWLGCFKTKKAAIALAKKLRLKVVK